MIQGCLKMDPSTGSCLECSSSYDLVVTAKNNLKVCRQSTIQCPQVVGSASTGNQESNDDDSNNIDSTLGQYYDPSS